MVSTPINFPLLNSFQFEVVTVDKQGNILQRETKLAEYFTEDLGNGITLELVGIPGGKFLMGAPENEEGSLTEERPQHEVTVQSFFMGKFPVTQAQWKAIASLPQVNRHLNPEPSYFKGKNRPVEMVSWYDAVEFGERLFQKTGRKYRLPSEAEWEYAIRAGTTTPFHFGETLKSDLANYNNNAKETTTVGSFPPNAFGLHDMHGQVWEWCADEWHDSYKGAPSNGSARHSSGNQNFSPLRGGSWGHRDSFCRSAFRSYIAGHNSRFNYLGFRVVCGGGRTD